MEKDSIDTANPKRPARAGRFFRSHRADALDNVPLPCYNGKKSMKTTEVPV